jgi:tRNA(fMet)-specific endonuclease VapC
MYLLDTDHLTLLERGGGDSVALQMRLEQVPPAEIATTIVTYEEQMRGWLARAAQARTVDRMLGAYSRLQVHVETFKVIPVLPFEAKAAAEFQRLQRARCRIGTMDLKIAALALASDATLLSRNLSDFRRVAGLRVEDWTNG